MKKFKLAFILFLCLVPSYGETASEVNFKEAEITFSLPDTWESTGSSSNRVAPKMDSSDPLYVAWKRTAILDKGSNLVSAGLNITVFNVPPDANVVLASSRLMRSRGWPFKEFLTTEKDGLMLPNSLGYLTEFSPRDGLRMKVFVVHSINNGKFVEVNLSATDDIFPQVESEFRAMLKSLRLSTGEHPIPPPPTSLEDIVEIVRKAASTGFIDVTIDYIEPDLYISGHSYSKAHVASLMRSIVIGRPSNLRIVELIPQKVEDLSTLAFRLVESDIKSVSKWEGPITFKFPRSANSAEFSANILNEYSLNDLVFLTVIGTGQKKRAVIRSPDGALFPVQVGNFIGKERALINEISEKSIILLERAGIKRELKIVKLN